MHNNDDDVLLVQLARQGDLDAFEQLVGKYEKKVYTIAYRYTGNHADASDLAQEAFIKVYRSIKNFRGESSLITWLSRVVTNVCLDELRRRAKQKLVSMDEMKEKGQSPIVELRNKPLEDIIIKNEWQEEVQKLITGLSEEYRTVILLRDVEGYTYEEIATILDCSLGTVKSRLNRARNVLKTKLLARQDLTGLTCHGH